METTVEEMGNASMAKPKSVRSTPRRKASPRKPVITRTRKLSPPPKRRK